MRPATPPFLVQRRLRLVESSAAAETARFDTMYQPAAAPSAGKLDTATACHAAPPFVDHSRPNAMLAAPSSLR